MPLTQHSLRLEYQSQPGTSEVEGVASTGRRDDGGNRVASGDQGQSGSPWLLQKPTAIASAEGTWKEIHEDASSTLAPATGHNTRRFRVRNRLHETFTNHYSSFGVGWSLFRHDQLGDPTCPYIKRWVLDLGPLGAIRLHHWLADDDPRAFHDHPWGFLTLVLWGSYTDVSWPEWVKTVDEWPSRTLDSCRRYDQLHAGSIRWRPAYWAHTVETHGAWTLLWTQPKRRYFGFWVQRTPSSPLKWIKANRWFGQYGHKPCE